MSLSNRIIVTPSPFAKEQYLYVQEVGALTSLDSHMSHRENLDSYLFFMVLSGKGTFYYNEKSYSLKQGQCVWIDCKPSYAHESSSELPWELKWVHFNGKSVCHYYKYFLEQEKPFVFTPTNGALFNEALSTLFSLHNSNHSQKDILSNKYLTDIITSCFTENTGEDAKESMASEKLEQIRDYLSNHFTETIHLDQLSKLFYISKYHLAREYKKKFGITLVNDLTIFRISHGKSLLRFSSLPIEQVSMACGYPDANYFVKVFKKMEAITPLEYRHKW